MRQELCVEGFPLTVTQEELKSMFSACGLVLSVELESTENGLPLGIARVEMGSAEEAQRALRLLHRTTVGGRRILVFPAPQNSSMG